MQKIKKKIFFTSCPKSAVGGYKLIFLEKNSYGHPQPKVRKSLEISGMSSEDFLSKGQTTVGGGGWMDSLSHLICLQGDY